MCFFSIIVPVYNAGEFLVQCLSSIEEQTFKDFEVVLVDDDSTDGSPEVIKEYANRFSNIKAVSIKHVPVGEVRNVAILNATGKYLVFVDADDRIDPKMLENLYRCLNLNRADICFMPSHSIDTAGGIFEHDFIRQENEDRQWEDKASFLDYIVSKEGVIPAAMWTVVCSTDLIRRENIRFNPEYLWSEDSDYIFSLLTKSYRIAVCSYRGYIWNRRNVRSSSNSFSANKLNGRLSVYKKWYDALDDNCFGILSDNTFQYIRKYLLRNYCDVLFQFSFVKNKSERRQVADKFKEDSIWRNDETLVIKEYYRYGLFLGRLMFLARHYRAKLISMFYHR